MTGTLSTASYLLSNKAPQEIPVIWGKYPSREKHLPLSDVQFYRIHIRACTTLSKLLLFYQEYSSSPPSKLRLKTHRNQIS